MAFVTWMGGAAWASESVREALQGSIPLSASDSIESLTRFSATRLGVETFDKDTRKKNSEWAELTPEAMERVLEAASIAGLSVTVADAEALAPPPPSPSSRNGSVLSTPPEERGTGLSSSHSKLKSHPPNETDSDHNRFAYLSYQTLLSTYVYGVAIPVAYGIDNPRYLIAWPLLTAPVAFGTHLWISRDMEFTEAHLMGTMYFPTLTVYAATALPLAFSGGNFRDGYRIASVLGAVAYPLGVWYGYHLGDVYRSDPDQIETKYSFALGYGILGFATPTLYYEHPSPHSGDILRLGFGQSVGMAVLGHFVADYYHPSSDAASGVPLGIFTHALLGGLGGIEAATLLSANSVRPWIGATVLGSTLGFTEGVFFFESSNDSFNRARYSLVGALGGAMVGTGLELLLYDGNASARSQRVGWTSSIIGGAWLGYWSVYLLTSEMQEAPHSRAQNSSSSPGWAFNPLPVLEPVLSRGDVATRWRIPGFSRHF